MASKTKIKLHARKKTNPELVEIILLARKNENWLEIAKILSSSTRKQPAVNLSEINKNSKIGDTIIIPGKVLSKGNIAKKIKLCAFSISEQAREKLKETKSEFIPLIEEISKNKKAEGIKIIT